MSANERPRRLVVGITGATGIIYGIRALELARELGIETHLVISKAGELTRAYESDLGGEELRALADVVYPIGNIGGAIASGSFQTDGMLIAPCSIKTLAAVAHGFGDNLLTRAADVTLKERRRLVLMVREAPLTLAHIRAMEAVTENGGIVMPPVPAFYLRPRSLDELVTHTVSRALDVLGFPVPELDRWDGSPPTPPVANGRP
jgi:4-hydroxy-3-polyprenylbenzoate decarboxylase